MRAEDEGSRPEEPTEESQPSAQGTQPSTAPPTIHLQYYYSVSDPEDTTIANISVVPRHNTIFVSNLWVHGKHRREGLGRRLFSAAVADHGWRRLWLHVASYTDRAFNDPELTAWYGRFGFEPTDVPGALVRPPSPTTPPPWLAGLSDEDLGSLEAQLAAVRASRRSVRGEDGHA